MIHIRRSRVPTPRALRDAEARRAFQQAAHFFFEPHGARRQRRFEFAPLTETDGVRDALFKLFRGKCAYCESTVERGEAIVDLLRPRTSALGLEKEFNPDHYWWLAYRWQNLHLTCSECAYLKGTKFPVDGDRAPLPVPPPDRHVPEAPAAAWIDALNSEKRLLVDPCADEIGKHLTMGSDGKLAAVSRRGAATIEIIGLNRGDLVAARREHAQWVREKLDELFVKLGTKDYEALKQCLRRLLAPRRRYRMLTLRLLRPWVRRHRVRLELALDPGQMRSLKETVEEVRQRRRAAPATRVNTKAIRTAMVRSVELRNFKAITNLKLPLPITGDRVPWLMLLGENGSGKSSILQAVALALMGDVGRRKLRLEAPSVLRHGARSGFVKVRLSGYDAPVQLSFSADSPDFHGHPSEPQIQVFGYGATRLLPKGKVRARRDGGMVRVQNLFEHFTPLIDAEKWLNRLTNKEFDYQALVLNDLLSIQQPVRLVRVWEDGKRRTRVRLYNHTIALDELSDGFQSIVALTTDIMKGLQPRWKGQRADVAEGLVLLDEIGAHLHPRLKMRIVERIRCVAPRVQFIATTHEPLCLHGLADGEVAVLQRGPRGKIYLEPDLPPIQGMKVDQLLTSEHFGLGSTIDPQVDDWLRAYYRLLSRDKLSPGKQAELKDLRAKLDEHHVLGQDERDRLVYEAIDTYVARKKDEASRETRRRLKRKTLDVIASMWEG